MTTTETPLVYTVSESGVHYSNRDGDTRRPVPGFQPGDWACYLEYCERSWLYGVVPDEPEIWVAEWNRNLT